MSWLIFLMSAFCQLIPSQSDKMFLDQPELAEIGSCNDDKINVEGAKIYANGQSGNDEIADKSPANNQIQAGTGNDIIYAGAGNDVYYGGRGHDLFIFEGNFGRDIIADFSLGNFDRIAFVVYEEGLLDGEKIIEQYSHQLGSDVVIAFNDIPYLQKATLTIKNMDQKKLRPKNFHIIVYKP